MTTKGLALRTVKFCRYLAMFPKKVPRNTNNAMPVRTKAIRPPNPITALIIRHPLS